MCIARKDNKFEYFLNALFYCMWLREKKISQAIQKFVYSIADFLLTHFFLQRIRQKCYENKRRQKDDADRIMSLLDIEAATTWLEFASLLYLLFPVWIIIGLLFKFIPDISFIYLMIVILPPVAISHYKLDKAVFKKKRYLEYFKEFEKKDEKWHKKWKRLTNVFLLGSIITTGIGLIIVFIINGMISI